MLALVAAIVTGWLVGCGEASSAQMLVEYRRSGGFAGLDDHLVIMGSGESILTRKSERYEFTLDHSAVADLRSLFKDAEFSQLGPESLPSRQGSDLFEYVVTYERYAVRTMDGAVPPSLQPILEALDQIVEYQGKP